LTKNGWPVGPRKTWLACHPIFQGCALRWENESPFGACVSRHNRGKRSAGELPGHVPDWANVVCTEKGPQTENPRAEGPTVLPAKGNDLGRRKRAGNFRPNGPTVLLQGERLARWVEGKCLTVPHPRALPWAEQTNGPSARRRHHQMSQSFIEADHSTVPEKPCFRIIDSVCTRYALVG
jgi:hypothetical protein